MTAEARHSAEPEAAAAEDLTWDEAVNLAKRRDQLTGRIREAEDKPRHLLHLQYSGGLFGRWVWWIRNERTDDLLATGKAWTKRGATRRRYRAYLRVLDGAA